MELVIYDNDNASNIINLNNSTILFGQNNKYKNDFVNILKNGLLGKNKNIIVDGRPFNFKEYNVICMDEDNDFINEFKFTKNNTFRQMIYDDVINRINEEKIIDYTNEIFDVIDTKVNKLLDRKFNKKCENNISFEIEIPDVNTIIDKFTNIYIDNMLVSSDKISKSMKRKLLYQLYFWEIENNYDKHNIILLENFDAYLCNDELITIINKINKLTNDNCHFILTSCNNIFEYIELGKFSVYKITNKLVSLEVIDTAIKNYLLRREFLKLNIEQTFDIYSSNNEHLLTYDDIVFIRNKIFNKYPHLISKILNCTNIKIVPKKPKNIFCEYIICDSKDTQELFLEISSKFID